MAVEPGRYPALEMRFSILTLLIFVSLIGGCLAWALGPSRVRSALPWNATEIEEHYDGLASDFIRILRARIDVPAR